jgi:ribose transport system permease protein
MTKSGSLRLKNLSQFTPYLVLLVLVVAMSFISDNFLTFSNIISVLRQSSFLLVMAIGMTFAMILGRGIDMSIGATVALTSCIAAPYLKEGKSTASIILGFVIALGLGALIGAVNGILIAYFDMPAMLVTYGMQNILRGLIFTIMEGSIVTNLCKAVSWMGAGFIGKIPVPIIIAAILTVITTFVIYRTPIGRKLILVGSNPQAAKFSGIKSNLVIVAGFSICGLMAALARIMYIGRLGTAEATIGSDFHLNAMAAAAIGGVSFGGGAANPIGVVAGAIIIYMLMNAINLLNISSSWQGIVNGVIILFAVLVDYFSKRSKV